MNTFTFGEEITAYYGLKEKVAEEIGKLVKDITDEDLDLLWEGLKFNVSPSKRIGVSDVYEMCMRKNIAIKRAAPVKLPVHDAVCEVCGKQFSWKLLCNEEDTKNGVTERCPRCGFFWEDTWLVKRYEDGVNAAREKYREEGVKWEPCDFGKEHREYVEKYRRKFQAGTVGPRAEAQPKKMSYADYKAMVKRVS